MKLRFEIEQNSHHQQHQHHLNLISSHHSKNQSKLLLINSQNNEQRMVSFHETQMELSLIDEKNEMR